MSEQMEFNLQSFQTEVMQQLEVLQQSSSLGRVQEGRFVPLSGIDAGHALRLTGIGMQAAQAPENAELSIGGYEGRVIVVAGHYSGDWIYSAHIVDDDASKLVARKDIRQYLCPALEKVSNDAFEIAKIITPILAPLVLAGTISVPLSPILFAVSALLIARMGVTSFCAGYKDRDKDKDKR